MKIHVSVEDRVYEVEVDMPQHFATEATDTKPSAVDVPESVLHPRPPQRLPEDFVVRAPMAGRVVAILASPSDKIRRHQGVILLDAMKMEIPIGPAVDGTLHLIHVAAGDSVAAGQILFEMAR